MKGKGKEPCDMTFLIFFASLLDQRAASAHRDPADLST